MTSHPPSLAREIDAALAWWHAAGVDCDFADDARAWLADPASLAPGDAAARGDPAQRGPAQPALVFSRQPGEEPVPPAPSRTDYLGESPPASLADFQRWWMEAELPGQGTLHPRIAPRGPEGASLMVVVPDPEAEDRSTLLSGPQGRLLANILAAMGLSEGECYVASALPCHTPLADLPGLARGGLDTVLARHIALVAPRRVVLFGKGLGAFLPQDGGAGGDESLRGINHKGPNAPVMLAETLASMGDAPALKVRFWRRWVEWAS